MIVVCGEALIDMIHNGDGTQRAAPGGGPFNTARALARLGVPTAFLGHLSSDAFGQELAFLLEQDGASLQFATIGPEKTTIAVAAVDSEGLAEYQFLVQGTSAPDLTPEMIPSEFGPDVIAIHLGTLGMVLEPMAHTLVGLAERERGKRLLMLDPNIRVGLTPDVEYRERLHHMIGLSTVVKASDADLAWLYPGIGFELAAERILDAGVDMVVVTLGADGAFGAHRDARVHVPAPQVHVVDTIGAGDAFGASLLAWLHDHDRIRPELRLNHGELRAALGYACLAAAITCMRAGADPPRKSELVPA
ncbi:MAG TPA: carbohydrate kinase [Candidatus Dormibacteraeota bacterium]|nr:carbohydrate kinase [Candidatus Dormibacteraeota bacterium]HEX2680210.1 carbohydrate kinase [Candidatus Dormibacteraeota bacterium]